MADDHRRVESRQIVGTGMATDPQRLQEISDEQGRRERAWREFPERGFGEVLQTAPAKGALIDEAAPDPRRQAANVPATEASDPAKPAEAAEQSEPPKPKATSSKPLPRVPDPRERLLRARLAALEAQRPSPVTKK